MNTVISYEEDEESIKPRVQQEIEMAKAYIREFDIFGRSGFNDYDKDADRDDDDMYRSDHIHVGIDKLGAKKDLADHTTSALPQNSTLIATVQDAYDVVHQMMMTQSQQAFHINATPNVSITGDMKARLMMLTLLPRLWQRRLFIEFVSDIRRWPRIRSLFGVPPYAFLTPADMHMLRAGGIGKGRAQLAYDSANPVPTYSQFGYPHFVDQFGREYLTEVDQSKQFVEQADDPVGAMSTLANVKHGVRLFVRIKKRSKKQKIELLKTTDGKKLLFFPHIGEIIRVVETTLAMQARRSTDKVKLTLKVERVTQRTNGASTALVILSKQ